MGGIKEEKIEGVRSFQVQTEQKGSAVLSVKDDEHITVNFKYNTNKQNSSCLSGLGSTTVPTRQQTFTNKTTTTTTTTTTCTYL